MQCNSANGFKIGITEFKWYQTIKAFGFGLRTGLPHHRGMGLAAGSNSAQKEWPSFCQGNVLAGQILASIHMTTKVPFVPFELHLANSYSYSKLLVI